MNNRYFKKYKFLLFIAAVVAALLIGLVVYHTAVTNPTYYQSAVQKNKADLVRNALEAVQKFPEVVAFMNRIKEARSTAHVDSDSAITQTSGGREYVLVHVYEESSSLDNSETHTATFNWYKVFLDDFEIQPEF